MLISLFACGPSLDPASREAQPVETPWGGVIAAPAEPPLAQWHAGPLEEGRFLMGTSGSLAVGGGPGPHGENDGWIVALPDRRESWLGGPEWEVLHAIAPLGEGWLVAGVGVDRRGPVEVVGAVWVARLDAALVPAWERRFHGGQDHVAAAVSLGDRVVVLALGGDWNDTLKPLSGWVVRADGSSEPLPVDLGRVQTAAAAPLGPTQILLATTDQAGRHFLRWVDVP